MPAPLPTQPPQGRRPRLGLAPQCLLLALSATAPPAEESTPPAPRWCVDSQEQLESQSCVANVDAEEDTLILFLHGVIAPDTTWQWTQQRAAARAGQRHHAVVLSPRGRRGHGPRGMEDWWTWPTSAKAQSLLEQELLAEWRRDLQQLEQRRERPFQRVYVLGFSNGAYYATSLALRGAFAADGYGLFAGGAAGAWLERSAKRLQRRPPIYVGWGSQDRARRDPSGLLRLLRALGWPAAGQERKQVGHTMTDSMVDAAFTLFHARQRER